jgi:hypothetical protein
MDRRRFFGTVGAGLALAVTTNRAHAFTVEVCNDESSAPACRELLRHRDIRAQLDLMLKEHRLADDQREALLAAAMCPFCGQAVSPGPS